jgi:hypothetical protein
MPCNCFDNLDTIDRVAHLLDAVKDIRIDDLERIVQQAHECGTKEVDEPAEPFPITRQALRMFWHFRRNLDFVQTRRF